jgi:2Fe-2S ferredoxin
MVTFTVEDHEGNRQSIEAPDDMGLSLMEILKASEYPVLATCGGMALCATCHVEVMEGQDQLGEATDVELDQLENLP